MSNCIMTLSPITAGRQDVWGARLPDVWLSLLTTPAPGHYSGQVTSDDEPQV